jgi:hypothetical protein
MSEKQKQEPMHSDVSETYLRCQLSVNIQKPWALGKIWERDAMIDAAKDGVTIERRRSFPAGIVIARNIPNAAAVGEAYIPWGAVSCVHR